MKRRILAFLICLISLTPVRFIADPSKCNVTGIIGDAGGNQALKGTVVFNIIPQSTSNMYRVVGTSVIAPTTVTCPILPSSPGTPNVNCTVWGNDNITPAGTVYQVVFKPNGVQTQVWQGIYIFGPTYDLSHPTTGAPNVQQPQFVIPSGSVPNNLFPAADNAFNLGTDTSKWATIHAYSLDIANFQTPLLTTNNVTVNGPLTASSATVNGPLIASSVKGSIQDTGGQVYNVKAYGAVGNGSTNDLTSINNAQSAACSAGGGVIRFPHGTYPVGTGITVSCNNLTFEGEGKSSSHLICNTGASSVCFNVLNVSNINIRGLDIDGQSNTVGPGNCPVTISNSSYVRVENDYVHDGANCNILVETTSSYTSVLNNWIGNVWGSAPGAGIEIGNNVTSSVVSGNILTQNNANTGEIMIDVNWASGIILNENILNMNASTYAGLEIEASSGNVSDISAVGNTIISPTQHGIGIYLAVGGGTAHVLSNVSVTGGTLNGAYLYINDANSTNPVMHGLSISGVTLTNYAGNGCMQLVGSGSGAVWQGLSISGNTFYTCGSSGSGAVYTLNAGANRSFSFFGNTIRNSPAGTYGLFQTGGLAGLINWGDNDTSGAPAGPINTASNILGTILLSGAPGAACQSGALATSSAGGATTTLYVCAAGAWVSK